MAVEFIRDVNRAGPARFGFEYRHWIVADIAPPEVQDIADAQAGFARQTKYCFIWVAQFFRNFSILRVCY